MLDAGSGTVQEARDRAVGAQRCEQLDLGLPGLPVGRAEHRLGHPHHVVRLPVQLPQTQRLRVPGDGGVQVGHRDAHVVDPDHADLSGLAWDRR